MIAKCFNCSLGVITQDGAVRCQKDFSIHPEGCSDSFVQGHAKLFKLGKDNQREMVKQRPLKVKPIKNQKIKTIVKKEQKQQRLF